MPLRLEPVTAVGYPPSKKNMGMVAATAHHSGSRKSAKRPTIVKTVQNIFFRIGSV